MPIPATKGANVRTIGTKRAIMMVFPPYFYKIHVFFQMTLLKYTGIGIIEKFISKKVSYHIITGIAQHS